MSLINQTALNAARQAALRIAPIWPLDQTVAVNPWWQMRDQPITQVAAQLASLADIQLLMPKDYYRQYWQNSLLPQHLQQAAQEQGITCSIGELVEYLDKTETVNSWQNLSDCLDGQATQAFEVERYRMALSRVAPCRMPWCDEITHQISQSCGMFFSYPDRLDESHQHGANFYQFWRELIIQDAGIAILMDEPELTTFFKALPDNPETLISQFYSVLNTANATFNKAGVKENDVEETSSKEKTLSNFATSFEVYCLALLLDNNGWAAVFTQRDRSVSSNNDLSSLSGCTHLLAVRLAWEWAIWKLLEQKNASNAAINASIKCNFIAQFQQQKAQKAQQANAQQQQEYLWVWHRALEISVQQQFEAQLLSNKTQGTLLESNALNATLLENNSLKNVALKTTTLQAVFCIDVRSEPMRRALEALSPDIQTVGFAGFFGLPIAYDPVGVGVHRPQLPALLSPTLYARPVLSKKSQQQLLSPLLGGYATSKASAQASANFGWVESKGWFEGLRMLGQSFGIGHKTNPQECFAHVEGWQLWQNDKPLEPTEVATLLAGVLRHMGLSSDFAPRILLVAHASSTANNAMNAGLDCGACGGQSGEVNVRVLAYFLNKIEVREALHQLGIDIPTDTQFIACLHNTTTDDIEYFAATNQPDQQTKQQSEQSLEYWQTWLTQASSNARTARANVMNISAKTTSGLKRAFKQLSNDWAQLRPEWGLNNNAAFIVAPRSATRHLNFDGRAFLHDYNWQTDAKSNYSTLELIMTAPMIVAHWINFQYYASVTDNLHYGSGNKLLHNVVGGHLGVFEGNGGDLRIGLPMQSVHDGKHWRHQPIRLNVYLAAPRDAIAAIIEKHADIKLLIDNQWVYLFQWQSLNSNGHSEQKQISRYFEGQWMLVNPSSNNIT